MPEPAAIRDLRSRAARGDRRASERALRAAQRRCDRLARRHPENFPVAWLLPAEARPALRAIYAFARVADDFADEEAHAGHRSERLDAWESMLRACFRGEADHPVFVALRAAVERHALPAAPFHDLLAAFRMDLTRTRHADAASLEDYCRLSANPVGRLVLHVTGHRDPALLAWSDALCTALQLTNHWQDVGIDWRRGRVYLPADARERWGVRDEDLAAAPASEAFRGLLREQCEATRRLYAAARPLCDAVGGGLRLQLRLTWLGGSRVLDRIAAARYDVLSRRPALDTADLVLLAGRALLWRAA
jgi:phytoene synthase